MIDTQGLHVESVTVTGPDALAVEVQADGPQWYHSELGISIWRPTAPLAPNTEYTVSAVLAPQEPMRPTEATSSESIEFSFTTGSESAPPLALDGELQVRLERAELPVMDCSMSPCGASGCVETGTRSALMAHVTVPAVQGGVDLDGYRGWLTFTDNSPAEFAGPGEDVSGDVYTVKVMQWVTPEAGTEFEVVLEIFEEEQAYRPCLAYNVWDPRRQNAVAEAVCLEEMNPRDVLAADTDPVPLSTSEGSTTSGGCSLAAAPTSGQAGCFAFAALGALVFALRFDRQTRARP